MEVVNQIFAFIGKLFEWWYTVMPWEQAVFVRKGNNAKIVSAGLYFKIPFYDRVYIQQMRLRMTDLPMQTVSTKDGKTITIKAMVGYSIKDMLKMFNTISHPELTLCGIVMSGIAECLKNTHSNEISPSLVEAFVINKLKNEDFGLGDLTVKLTSWADVKTYRIIQDQSYAYEGLKMEYIGEKK